MVVRRLLHKPRAGCAGAPRILSFPSLEGALDRSLAAQIPPRPASVPRSHAVTAPGVRALAAEGAFQALAQGLAEAYLGAFALLLGAGGMALGLVATLPTASTSLAQVLARRARAGIG